MKNVYVEITNVCNLSCSFCPGHRRSPRFMSPSDFAVIAGKLDGNAENLFLHLMGEPLLHPDLCEILKIADEMTVKLKITTNGTLIGDALPLLCESKNLRTVCISLHSFEANHKGALDEYLSSCFSAADELAKRGKFVVFRLWNLDGDASKKAENDLNGMILEKIREHYPPEREAWVKNHRGERVATHVFLEWGEKFDWPDVTDEPIFSDADEGEYGTSFCHGLLTQAGVLADGTVVPCCLDRDGEIALGNLLGDESFDEIMNSPRARAMKEAMAHHRFTEALCRGCGFAVRFEKNKM